MILVFVLAIIFEEQQMGKRRGTYGGVIKIKNGGDRRWREVTVGVFSGDGRSPTASCCQFLLLFDEYEGRGGWRKLFMVVQQ